MAGIMATYFCAMKVQIVATGSEAVARNFAVNLSGGATTVVAPAAPHCEAVEAGLDQTRAKDMDAMVEFGDKTVTRL